jgi:hypothetical protein
VIIVSSCSVLASGRAVSQGIRTCAGSYAILNNEICTLFVSLHAACSQGRVLPVAFAPLTVLVKK